MILLGIDASITGTGVTELTLDDSFNIINIKMIGFSDVKKNTYSSSNLKICRLDSDYSKLPYHARCDCF